MKTPAAGHRRTPQQPASFAGSVWAAPLLQQVEFTAAIVAGNTGGNKKAGWKSFCWELYLRMPLFLSNCRNRGRTSY